MFSIYSGWRNIPLTVGVCVGVRESCAGIVCVCVCVCVRARVCVRVCVCVILHLSSSHFHSNKKSKSQRSLPRIRAGTDTEHKLDSQISVGLTWGHVLLHFTPSDGVTRPWSDDR